MCMSSHKHCDDDFSVVIFFSLVSFLKIKYNCIPYPPSFRTYSTSHSPLECFLPLNKL